MSKLGFEPCCVMQVAALHYFAALRWSSGLHKRNIVTSRSIEVLIFAALELQHDGQRQGKTDEES